MEGSESEALFDAFNLNPQRFINEVLNAVDDMLEGAFDFCLQEASSMVAGGGVDRAEELARGVSFLRHLTQAVVDKRMGMWEKYCLCHCFSVPDGFVLPKNKVSSVPVLQECLSDAELDSQLDFLREKLAAAGKESEELHRKIQLLEKQSSVSSSYEVSVAEVQQLFEEHSVHHMFQELGKAASELQKKMAELRMKRSEDLKQTRIEKIWNPNREQHAAHDKGLPTRLEDIQEMANYLRNL